MTLSAQALTFSPQYFRSTSGSGRVTYHAGCTCGKGRATLPDRQQQRVPSGTLPRTILLPHVLRTPPVLALGGANRLQPRGRRQCTWTARERAYVSLYHITIRAWLGK